MLFSYGISDNLALDALIGYGEVEAGSADQDSGFTDSTIAYQGYGRCLDREVIDQLKQLVQKGLEPDCTFLLEAPLTVG